MRSFISTFVSLFAIGALASAAEAHVAVANTNAPAGKSAVITFTVGHGCTTAAPANKKLDTRKIRIAIPAGITAVRAFPGDLGNPRVVKNGSAIEAVEWQKPVEDLLATDDNYYEVKIRIGVPMGTAFSKLRFNIEQTCEDSNDHSTLVVNWNEDEEIMDGNHAAFLKVVPARTNATGWNKLTVPRALTQEEVATYFGDATIVWRGMSAYSPNSIISELITNTPGVSALDGLAANDEVWVKY